MDDNLNNQSRERERERERERRFIGYLSPPERGICELENLKSFEKYDQWKKAKRNHKVYIELIAWITSLLLAYLIAWLLLKVSLGDIWNLLKSIFAGSEKVMEHIPKIEAIGGKLEKSLVGGIITWFSKKLNEEIMTDFLKGNTEGVAQAIRTYSLALIAVWFLVLVIIWGIFYFLIKWIVSKFIWKEPTLYEQKVD